MVELVPKVTFGLNVDCRGILIIKQSVNIDQKKMLCLFLYTNYSEQIQ